MESIEYFKRPFRLLHYYRLGFKLFSAHPIQYMAWALAPLAFFLATLFFAPIFAFFFGTIFFQLCFAGFYTFSSIQISGEPPLTIDFISGFTRLKIYRALLLYLFYSLSQITVSIIILALIYGADLDFLLSRTLSDWKTISTLMNGGVEELRRQNTALVVSWERLIMMPITFLLFFVQYNSVYFIIIKDFSILNSIKLAVIGVKKKFFGSLAFGVIALSLATCGALFFMVGVFAAIPIIMIAFNCGMIDQTGGKIPEC